MIMQNGKPAPRKIRGPEGLDVGRKAVELPTLEENLKPFDLGLRIKITAVQQPSGKVWLELKTSSPPRMRKDISTMSNVNLTAGYPFNRGRWVGPTESPFLLQPPLTKVAQTGSETNDVVQLTKAAANPSSSDGNTVKVQSGDSLSQLLLDRGYSLKEMLEKDEQGKTLIDRVAAENKLRNPNLIYPGQELSLPSKEVQEESACPCESDFSDDQSYESDFDYGPFVNDDSYSMPEYNYGFNFEQGLNYGHETNQDCGCGDGFLNSESYGEAAWSNEDSRERSSFLNDLVLV